MDPTIKKTTSVFSWFDRCIAQIFLSLINIYKWTLSPWLGRQCRYYPTCSSYAKTALLTHGGVHGLWLSLKRIGRCHPFSSGGVDEVPPKSCTRHNGCTVTSDQRGYGEV